jgi:glutathione synthase/RimK-type ligase-like ATP-grasp enzyme
MNIQPRSVLFEQAEKLGLNPQKIPKSGLFSVSYQGKTAYVYYTYSHLNSQLGASLATNKYLTREIAHQAGVKNIPYLYATNVDEVSDFFQHNHPIIAKPLFGSQSIGVEKITTQDQLKGYIHGRSLEELIFEKYIDGYELKNFILNGQILGVTKKILVNTGNAWSKNVEIVNKIDWNQELITQSLNLSKIMHLNLGTIDYIIDSNNQVYLLEINSRLALNDFYSVDEDFGKKLANKILITLLAEQLGDQFFQELKHLI